MPVVRPKVVTWFPIRPSTSTVYDPGASWSTVTSKYPPDALVAVTDLVMGPLTVARTLSNVGFLATAAAGETPDGADPVSTSIAIAPVSGDTPGSQERHSTTATPIATACQPG